MHATSHDGGTIRAASLVRVSTKGQADKGLSLDEQDRRVAKYISDQEWTPAGEYREPGVSGKRKDRPKLDRLLADSSERGRCTARGTGRGGILRSH
jgi:site-specific DNA recombinase